MKKLIAALLALSLLLSLTACGNNEKQSLEAPITETTAPVVDQTTGDSTDSTESIPNVTQSQETQRLEYGYLFHDLRPYPYDYGTLA